MLRLSYTTLSKNKNLSLATLHPTSKQNKFQCYPKTSLFFQPHKKPVLVRTHFSRHSSSYTLSRNPKYKQVDSDDASFFSSVLGKQNVLAAKSIGGDMSIEDLEKYNSAWLNIYSGSSKIVLFPETTHHVSKIMEYCNSNTIPVVPQGGNSGVQGASIPVFDEVILNMSKMNKIRSLDTDSGALVCDAGCILENLENYANEFGLTMPIDLGAKGSCHIGGNVSTNAGGLRYLKYGSLHGSVLGLEVVLPNGTVINNLSTLRKDSTGYDIKQLFIGAEGTLGVVTGVSILAAKKPMNTSVAILGLDSYKKVLQAFNLAHKHLSEILLAFEFWDADSMDAVVQLKGYKYPLDGQHKFYILIETGGSNADHDQQKLLLFLEESMENNTASDGILAQDISQQKKLWTFREEIIESMSFRKVVYKYDLSMPISKLYDIVGDTREFLIEKGLHPPHNLSENKNIEIEEDKTFPILSVNGFGHIGDGNLHLNVVAQLPEKKRGDATLKDLDESKSKVIGDQDDKVGDIIDKFVYEWIQKINGSISAEHGIGIVKPNSLHYSKNDTVIKIMKNIKNMFDPNQIMNPYKVLPK
ncbi:hypothetical protein BB559_003269 [Furculomyces boomerangus]|uniref:FAD-binding PCMH-type domain-containing protein n=2 Tax=Harpellales TaxID=61421 RepID=A0A2T9YMI4_9FUNG|nr:hypothetical protein BB559_003269 [Furculomyces boomerangus]PVZ99783.1 hypothetical protein BB558_004192 [Smittium angustum]